MHPVNKLKAPQAHHPVEVEQYSSRTDSEKATWMHERTFVPREWPKGACTDAVPPF